MAAYYSAPDSPTEPLRRFYPVQGEQTVPRIPSAPTPLPSRKKNDDAAYLMHRHPILLQRLYQAADTHLSAYGTQDFIYDSYPDYLSLGWMRDRILQENPSLTAEFLQAGCPLEWLNLLTDTVVSELLCRRRCAHRSPRGDASTTSVLSPLRS